MSGLAFDGVSKDFGDVVALRDLELEVGEGELVVVLGPSGAGKTTLLRLAAGLEAPSSGRITIRGKDVSALPPGRRNVAMVFQGYALFPHMTAAQNIAFGLIVRDVRRSEIDDRVRAAAELVGVSDLLARHPHELSGGERQRVALARALVREPDVFLFDEPLSNLDPTLRLEVRTELKRLHRQVGGTTLHVTHDQAEALVLGDRVAVVRGGKLEQIGAPDEIWRRPANRFVARFVGAPGMNILPADGPFRPGGLPSGRAVELGVRPEDVLVGVSGTDARVTLVESMGAEAYVYLEAGDTTLVARVGSDTALEPGHGVSVSVDPRRVHLFDASTGDRVEWS